MSGICQGNVSVANKKFLSIGLLFCDVCGSGASSIEGRIQLAAAAGYGMWCLPSYDRQTFS